MDIPAIVAEFVSKRKRDRVRDYEEKRREYQALGVREYWVIDRFNRTMTVFKNIPGEPAEVVVKAEETYRTSLLPGFELPLARLLKVADDWAKATSRRKKPADPKGLRECSAPRVRHRNMPWPRANCKTNQKLPPRSSKSLTVFTGMEMAATPGAS